MVTLPLSGGVDILYDKGSPSISSENWSKSMDNEISSSALTVPPTTIGTSLIGLITNVINPTLLNSTPSKALKVKESVPLKFKSGSY